VTVAVETPDLTVEIIDVPALLADGAIAQLSHSALMELSKCPRLFRETRLLGLKRPTTGAMHTGSAFGSAAQWYLLERQAASTPSPADTLDQLDAAFELDCEEVTFSAREPYDALREQTRDALSVWISQLAQTVGDVLAVERRMAARFSVCEWSLVGYADIECADGSVIDLKLRSRGHLTQGNVDRDEQASIYWLLRDAEAIATERFLFHSVVRGRSGASAEAVTTTREDWQLARTAHRVARDARLIEHYHRTGDWPEASPLAWWCAQGQCPAWAQCPAGGGAGLA